MSEEQNLKNAIIQGKEIILNESNTTAIADLINEKAPVFMEGLLNNTEMFEKLLNNEDFMKKISIDNFAEAILSSETNAKLFYDNVLNNTNFLENENIQKIKADYPAFIRQVGKKAGKTKEEIEQSIEFLFNLTQEAKLIKSNGTYKSTNDALGIFVKAFEDLKDFDQILVDEKNLLNEDNKIHLKKNYQVLNNKIYDELKNFDYNNDNKNITNYIYDSSQLYKSLVFFDNGIQNITQSMNKGEGPINEISQILQDKKNANLANINIKDINNVQKCTWEMVSVIDRLNNLNNAINTAKNLINDTNKDNIEQIINNAKNQLEALKKTLSENLDTIENIKNIKENIVSITTELNNQITNNIQNLKQEQSVKKPVVQAQQLASAQAQEPVQQPVQQVSEQSASEQSISTKPKTAEQQTAEQAQPTQSEQNEDIINNIQNDSNKISQQTIQDQVFNSSELLASCMNNPTVLKAILKDNDFTNKILYRIDASNKEVISRELRNEFLIKAIENNNEMAINFLCFNVSNNNMTFRNLTLENAKIVYEHIFNNPDFLENENIQKIKAEYPNFIRQVGEKAGKTQEEIEQSISTKPKTAEQQTQIQSQEPGQHRSNIAKILQAARTHDREENDVIKRNMFEKLLEYKNNNPEVTYKEILEEIHNNGTPTAYCTVSTNSGPFAIIQLYFETKMLQEMVNNSLTNEGDKQYCLSFVNRLNDGYSMISIITSTTSAQKEHPFFKSNFENFKSFFNLGLDNELLTSKEDRIKITKQIIDLNNQNAKEIIKKAIIDKRVIELSYHDDNQNRDIPGYNLNIIADLINEKDPVFMEGLLNNTEMLEKLLNNEDFMKIISIDNFAEAILSSETNAKLFYDKVLFNDKFKDNKNIKQLKRDSSTIANIAKKAGKDDKIYLTDRIKFGDYIEFDDEDTQNLIVEDKILLRSLINNPTQMKNLAEYDSRCRISVWRDTSLTRRIITRNSEIGEKFINNIEISQELRNDFLIKAAEQNHIPVMEFLSIKLFSGLVTFSEKNLANYDNISDDIIQNNTALSLMPLCLKTEENAKIVYEHIFNNPDFLENKNIQKIKADYPDFIRQVGEKAGKTTKEIEQLISTKPKTAEQTKPKQTAQQPALAPVLAQQSDTIPVELNKQELINNFKEKMEKQLLTLSSEAEKQIFQAYINNSINKMQNDDIETVENAVVFYDICWRATVQSFAEQYQLIEVKLKNNISSSNFTTKLREQFIQQLNDFTSIDSNTNDLDKELKPFRDNINNSLINLRTINNTLNTFNTNLEQAHKFINNIKDENLKNKFTQIVNKIKTEINNKLENNKITTSQQTIDSITEANALITNVSKTMDNFNKFSNKMSPEFTESLKTIITKKLDNDLNTENLITPEQSNSYNIINQNIVNLQIIPSKFDDILNKIPIEDLDSQFKEIINKSHDSNKSLVINEQLMNDDFCTAIINVDGLNDIINLTNKLSYKINMIKEYNKKIDEVTFSEEIQNKLQQDFVNKLQEYNLSKEEKKDEVLKQIDAFNDNISFVHNELIDFNENIKNLEEFINDLKDDNPIKPKLEECLNKLKTEMDQKLIANDFTNNKNKNIISNEIKVNNNKIQNFKRKIENFNANITNLEDFIETLDNSQEKTTLQQSVDKYKTEMTKQLAHIDFKNDIIIEGTELFQTMSDIIQEYKTIDMKNLPKELKDKLKQNFITNLTNCSNSQNSVEQQNILKNCIEVSENAKKITVKLDKMNRDIEKAQTFINSLTIDENEKQILQDDLKKYSKAIKDGIDAKLKNNEVKDLTEIISYIDNINKQPSLISTINKYENSINELEASLNNLTNKDKIINNINSYFVTQLHNLSNQDKTLDLKSCENLIENINNLKEKINIIDNPDLNAWENKLTDEEYDKFTDENSEINTYYNEYVENAINKIENLKVENITEITNDLNNDINNFNTIMLMPDNIKELNAEEAIKLIKNNIQNLKQAQQSAQQPEQPDTTQTQQTEKLDTTQKPLFESFNTAQQQTQTQQPEQPVQPEELAPAVLKTLSALSTSASSSNQQPKQVQEQVQEQPEEPAPIPPKEDDQENTVALKKDEEVEMAFSNPLNIYGISVNGTETISANDNVEQYNKDLTNLINSKLKLMLPILTEVNRAFKDNPKEMKLIYNALTYLNFENNSVMQEIQAMQPETKQTLRDK